MFIQGKSASDVSPTMVTFRLNQLASFAVELKHVVCSNQSQSHSLTCVLTEELLTVQQERTCLSLALAIRHCPPVAHFLFFSRVPLILNPCTLQPTSPGHTRTKFLPDWFVLYTVYGSSKNHPFSLPSEEALRLDE